MNGPVLGTHMPTAGGLAAALHRAREIGCEAVQIFTSSPQQWRPRPLASDAIETFRKAHAEVGSPPLVSHDSYLVNLATPDAELRAKSRTALALEMERCYALGIPIVVSHIGAHMGDGPEAGLERAAREIEALFAETPPSVALLAETTAGQGTVLNSRLEEIARLLERLGGHPRLGVCLDTCHVWAAGYPIGTREGYEALLAEFDQRIGLERLRALHLNDSKFGLGTRKDRHEHVGEGTLGAEALSWWVNEPRLAGIPAVIETPEAETRHAENLARLRALRRTS